MAVEVRTEILIESAPEVVWSVLTDLASYSEWNPFLIEASGEPAIGSRLELTMLNGKSRTRFKPVITVFERGKVLEWLGQVGIKGIFDGRHRFELNAVGAAKTRVIQTERFSGVTVPLIRGLEEQVKGNFIKLNEALRIRSIEQQAQIAK